MSNSMEWSAKSIECFALPLRQSSVPGQRFEVLHDAAPISCPLLQKTPTELEMSHNLSDKAARRSKTKTWSRDGEHGQSWKQSLLSSSGSTKFPGQIITMDYSTLLGHSAGGVAVPCWYVYHWKVLEAKIFTRHKSRWWRREA